MANKVLFEIVATAKGVKVVQNQTDKLAKSTDKATTSTNKLSKSRDSYHRREKGAAQISSNSTKNFSKMQQGIDGGGGSGGLVRAYALLAANVFALTAAFGVLSRSAQIDTLTQSMEILSTTGGTYIKSLAKDMQQASGGAIDLAQSFRQVSLASSAGLNTKEIEGLTQVAKGAAISLGRDLPDAMDRIFRGAIKLEPEILDEIGLFVRVDEAAQKYANSVGKSAGALTQAEKRQGFLNEILEQGKNKFQEYADTVKPDPYVRLGAALGDIAQSGLSLLNGVLGPILGFLAESQTMLSVVFGVLVFSLLKKAIPAMGQFNQGLAEQARTAADNAQKYSDGITETTKDQIKQDKIKLKSARDTAKKMTQTGPLLKLKVGGKDASGDLETKLQDKTIKGKKRQELIEKRILDLTKKQGLAKREQMPGYKEELAALQEEKRINKEILDLKNQKAIEPDSGSLAGRRQSSLNTKADRLAIVSGATDVGENQGMMAGFAHLNKDLKKNEKGLGMFGKAAARAQGSISLLGGGISRLMMMLGPFMMLFSMLAPLAMMLAKHLGIGSEEAKKFDSSLKSLGEMQEKINKRFDSQTDAIKNTKLSLVEQTKATLAYNKAQEGTFIQLEKLREELSTFQSEASNTALAWESLKSIFGLDKETKLIEAEADAVQKSIRAAALAGDEKQLAIFADLGNTDVDSYIAKVKELGDANKAANSAEANLENDSFKRKRELVDISKSINTALAKEALAVKTGNFKGRQKIEEKLAEIKEGLSEKEMAYVDALAAKNTAMKESDTIGKKIIVNEQKLKKLTEESTDSQESQRLAAQGYLDAQKAATESFGKFASAFKIKTKVDDVVNSFDELEKSFQKMGKDGVLTDGINADDFFKTFDGADNAFSALFSTKEIADIKENGSETFYKVVEQLKQYQDNIITSKQELKALSDVQKLSAKTAKFGGESAEIEQKAITRTAELKAKVARDDLKIQERSISKDAAKLETAIDIVNGTEDILVQEELLLETGLKRADVQTIIAARKNSAALTSEEQLAIDTEIARVGIAQNKAAQELLSSKKAILETDQKRLVVDAKIEQMKKTGSTTLNPKDEAKFVIDAALQKLRLEKEGLVLKKAMLDYEFKILKLQLLKLQKENPTDISLGNSEEGKETKMFKTLVDANVSAKGAIDAKLNLLQSETTLGFATAISKGFGDGLNNGLSVGAANIQAYKDSLKTLDKDGNVTDEGTPDEAVIKGMKLAVVRSTITSMGEELKKLGPEGELVATVVAGAMAMGDAFVTMTDALDKVGEGDGLGKAVAMAEFASAAIAQVTQMMAANSKAQMAEMDGQIEAEKRRDGKSKESVARIAQMEKKKETMAKKAFEQNKKMQMAQVVVNTASGIMRAYKDYDGLTATALAVMIGALGAAQLGIISKTQYQGTGAGDIPKPKTNLSIGNRSNNVDVSRGASGGELSYMRGERGVGSNANNFTPGGAMGRKGYAAGGEGILVGERGPEIVTPSQKVDIIPNDKLGRSTNVNFSINAVDAAGVEDLLVNQRGNIIRMIREAANENGEDFLTQVDPMAYGSNS